MRRTVRKEIQEAVAAYEDKPRDQWLFDYPAQVLDVNRICGNKTVMVETQVVVFPLSVLQVGLTGSQVWWATDVSIAFERVEEGFETALKDYNKKQVMLSLERIYCDV